MTEEKTAPGQWYVVHTLSGHEQKVKERLEKQIAKGEGRGVHEVLIPVEKISEVKQGRKSTTTRKYFPGYILIRMDLYKTDGKIDEEAWYFVRQTQGIIGFIGSGNRPLPLSPDEVRDLMGQIKDSEEKIVPKIDYDIGEMVKIRDGAFVNFEGTIEEIDQERGKLKLLVSIFGRSTPVELEYWQVERE